MGGCAHLGGGPPAGPVVLQENPMLIQLEDYELIWEQLVDTIDDYFRIQREDRVRVIGNVITYGTIETYPQSGSTWLEPWRRDSTRGYEKTLATLQSIRRRATVRVEPAEGGFRVHVVVTKELEDLDRPEKSTVGANTFRHDESLVRGSTKDDPLGGPATLGWIPLGRDTSLEQEILAKFLARL